MIVKGIVGIVYILLYFWLQSIFMGTISIIALINKKATCIFTFYAVRTGNMHFVIRKIAKKYVILF